jgi:hypothetical protein
VRVEVAFGRSTHSEEGANEYESARVKGVDDEFFAPLGSKQRD